MTTLLPESKPTRVIIPTGGNKFSTRIFASREAAEEYAKSIADRNPVIQDAMEKVKSQKTGFGKGRVFKANTCFCGRTKENNACPEHTNMTARRGQ